MKKLSLIAAISSFAFFGGTSEAAAADAQQTAASACVVTAGAGIVYSGASVGLTSGTGSATLKCPVDVNLASFEDIEVSYRDSDGTSSSGSVEVYIERVDKTSAVFGTSYVVFDSDNYSTTLWNNKVQALPSTFTFDHANYYYTVMIVLSRTSTSTFVPVGHVKLFTTP